MIAGAVFARIERDLRQHLVAVQRLQHERDGVPCRHSRTKFTPSASGVAPSGVERPRLVRRVRIG